MQSCEDRHSLGAGKGREIGWATITRPSLWEILPFLGKFSPSAKALRKVCYPLWTSVAAAIRHDTAHRRVAPSVSMMTNTLRLCPCQGKGQGAARAGLQRKQTCSERNAGSE